MKLVDGRKGCDMTSREHGVGGSGTIEKWSSHAPIREMCILHVWQAYSIHYYAFVYMDSSTFNKHEQMSTVYTPLPECETESSFHMYWTHTPAHSCLTSPEHVAKHGNLNLLTHEV